MARTLLLDRSTRDLCLTAIVTDKNDQIRSYAARFRRRLPTVCGDTPARRAISLSVNLAVSRLDSSRNTSARRAPGAADKFRVGVLGSEIMRLDTFNPCIRLVQDTLDDSLANRFRKRMIAQFGRQPS